MKKVLLTLAAMALMCMANAQITQGRIGNGDIVIYGTPWNDAYGIDFNNDGTLEFRLSDFEAYGGIMLYNGYISYDWTEGGNNIVADANIPDYVGAIAEGTTIGAASNFAGYGDATFEDATALPNNFYVGFRVKLADGVHYGWAKVALTVEGNNSTFNWTECYYNATVGAAIVAGQTNGGGTQGIAAVNENNVKAMAMGQQQMRIAADNQEVSVYAVDGRKVAQMVVNGEATITLPQMGVYVVRAAASSTKVVVF